MTIDKKCPVCEKHTFKVEFELCPVCKWQQDNVQEDDPTFWGGANKLCLNNYRAQYLKAMTLSIFLQDWYKDFDYFSGKGIYIILDDKILMPEVVDIMLKLFPNAEELRSLRIFLDQKSLWHMSKDRFISIRDASLTEIKKENHDTKYVQMLGIIELFYMLTYNATSPDDPFCTSAGWWLLPYFKNILLEFNNAGIVDEGWAIIENQLAKSLTDRQPSTNKGLQPNLCPCCGFYEYNTPSGSGDICPVCMWVDDKWQRANPDCGNGDNANDISLNAAKDKFTKGLKVLEYDMSAWQRVPNQHSNKKDKDGNPIIKEHKWVTSDVEFENNLRNLLPHERKGAIKHRHYRRSLLDARTRNIEVEGTQ